MQKQMYILTCAQGCHVWAVSPVGGAEFVPFEGLETLVERDEQPLLEWVMEGPYLVQLFPVKEWAEAVGKSSAAEDGFMVVPVEIKL